MVQLRKSGADGKNRRTVRIPGTGVYDTEVVGGARKKAHGDSRAPSQLARKPAAPLAFRFGPISLAAPITAKGYGSTIEFDGQSVSIAHSGLRKINRLTDLTFPISDVHDVVWKKPKLAINGTLRLVLIDAEGFRTDDADPMPDTYTVIVTKQQSGRVDELLGALEFSRAHPSAL